MLLPVTAAAAAENAFVTDTTFNRTFLRLLRMMDSTLAIAAPTMWLRLARDCDWRT